MRNSEYLMPMKLQFFGNGDGTEGEGTGAETNGDGTEPMSFDDFLGLEGNQAEFDRRIAKALETSRSKMQSEFAQQIADAKTEAEKMAKMNAEQKAKYEQDKKVAELTQREAEINRRELTATAKEQLAEMGLPIALSSVLDYTDAESCTKSIETIGKAFQETVEKAVNEKLAGGKAPKKADNNQTFTVEQIRTMTPEQINANWDAVQAAMKSGR